MGILAKIDESLNQFVWSKIKIFLKFKEKPKPTLNLSEQVKAELEQVVYDRKSGRYNEALHRVETVLIQDPNIPMAALLKALILWEGFGESYTAKLGLQRVMELVPDKNSSIHKMATNLMEKIDQSRRDIGGNRG